MKSIEFEVSPLGDKMIVHSDKGIFEFSPEAKDVIQYTLDYFSEYYPEAYAAVLQLYSKAFQHKYLMAKRLFKCNLLNRDEKQDIDVDGNFKLEFVTCPLRGECRHEGIICMPKFNTKLSDREYEVAKLIAKNLTADQIAEILFISPHTVKNHRNHILNKLNINSVLQIAQFIERHEK